jgi:hypothetical protein
MGKLIEEDKNDLKENFKTRIEAIKEISNPEISPSMQNIVASFSDCRIEAAQGKLEDKSPSAPNSSIKPNGPSNINGNTLEDFLQVVRTNKEEEKIKQNQLNVEYSLIENDEKKLDTPSSSRKNLKKYDYFNFSPFPCLYYKNAEKYTQNTSKAFQKVFSKDFALIFILS